MTKYVLHGGNIRGTPDKGYLYHHELVKGLDKNPRFLLCFFALPAEVWKEKYTEWVSRISQNLSDFEPTFELANQRDFDKQSKSCDVLYIYGGDNKLLMLNIKKSNGFVESLDKIPVVAGSSAGAIILAEYSWGCDRREVSKGLGIVPTNVLVHYKGEYGANDPRGPIDWSKAESELRRVIGARAKISKLAEGMFEVYNG